MTLFCTPAFKAVVDAGVNVSPLILFTPRLLLLPLLYALREVIYLWDVECCEAEITGSYLDLLSQV